MTNAKTDKATLLGQNNHEFQVVITVPPFADTTAFLVTILGHLRHARPKKFFTVCLRIHLGGAPDPQPRISRIAFAFSLRQ
jgi:hypothetical protein